MQNLDDLGDTKWSVSEQKDKYIILFHLNEVSK